MRLVVEDFWRLFCEIAARAAALACEPVVQLYVFVLVGFSLLGSGALSALVCHLVRVLVRTAFVLFKLSRRVVLNTVPCGKNVR